jgi:hypothetical protein
MDRVLQPPLVILLLSFFLTFLLVVYIYVISWLAFDVNQCCQGCLFGKIGTSNV